MEETPQERLQLFRHMVLPICGISFWTFNSSLELIEADSEMPAEMIQLFSFENEQIFRLLNSKENLSPVVLTNQLSMAWIADFEHNDSGVFSYLYLIGPVFVESDSIRSIRRKLSNLKISDGTMQDFSNVIDHIPMVSITHFLEYGIMMHYCIWGVHISASDFSYITAPKGENWAEELPGKSPLHTSWVVEQQMLKQIEEGNIHYKDTINQLSQTAFLANIGNGQPLRQVKNLVIIYTALCARAAIRGGLDPDIAYTLSDRYIGSVESSVTIPEIAEINAAMQEDYIRRVHHEQSHPEISPQIRKCCAYIQFHLGEPLTLSDLAGYIGYSESYLSKRFKEDTGMTIREYRMQLRVERAKELLRSSGLSVADVCEQLGFESQSYFGSQFRKATGMTPMEYRNTFLKHMKN